MPHRLIDPGLLVLYAIAAISGGLGGAIAGAYYATHSNKPRVAMLAAYFILGVVFGAVTLMVSIFIHHTPADMNTLSLEALVGGLAGAITLASANFTARLIFRYLGIEIQFTARQRGEDRRHADTENDHQH